MSAFLSTSFMTPTRRSSSPSCSSSCICLHFILSAFVDDYRPVSTFTSQVSVDVENSDALHFDNTVANDSVLPSKNGVRPNIFTNSTERRANATFVLLARNSDLNGVVSSIQQVEDRFNSKYNYPWVILNDEPFTDEFKERASILTRAPISFGLIPREHWVQPDSIDEDRARAGRQKMISQGIIYAGSVSYRNMCRYNSGFFFHHELLQPYKYYWRVEPDVKFFCDVDYDPFLYMEDHNKIYGFTISLVEWEATIPTLWSTVRDFMKEYPQHLDPHNGLGFLSDNAGESYNLCHFWSNFEIADMDFWRGEAYQDFFNYLDAKGGFYYERWGDAPVHSIAATLFARRDQIHFFRDIGYKHESLQHCPDGDIWKKGRCSCDPHDTFDYHYNSCLKRYERLFT